MQYVIRLAVAGVMIGTLYGAVAVSLTLMLRSSGVLSFAHAGFALASAYVYSGSVCPAPKAASVCGDPILSPGVAAAAGVAVAIALALLTERFVARPLERATAATKVIATAAVLGLIGGGLLQVFGSVSKAVPPVPDRQLLPIGSFEIAGVVINKPQCSILLISVALVAVLGLLLRKSWFGLGLRAAGQLPGVARLMGVNPVAVARFNWALGGLLAGLAGVLIGPITVVNIGTFSFLLVRAVGATLIGGLVSLPLTFVGGIGIGAIEALAPYFWHTQGVQALAVAALVLVMLRVHGNRFQLLRYAGPTSEVAVSGPAARATARSVHGLRELARKVPRPVWVLVAVSLVSFPLRDVYYASVGVVTLYYCLVALSLLAITGVTGQVSFMQAGFVAVGAFGFATATHQGWNLLVAMAVSVAVCVAGGILVGVIALRFRGLEFAIASVAVGAVLSEFVVTRGGIQTNVASAQLFGWNLLDSRRLFAVMLLATALCMILVRNMRRSGWGRNLAMMREMHIRVGHFGVAPLRSEGALLALSAGLAGLAGCFLALTITLDPFVFVPLVSVTLVLAAVVGGLQSMWGPVVTGLVFGVGQEVVGRVFSQESANAFPQIASALLAIVLIVGMPNGLSSMFSWARDVVGRIPLRPEIRFRGRDIPALVASGGVDTVPHFHMATPSDRAAWEGTNS